MFCDTLLHNYGECMDLVELIFEYDSGIILVLLFVSEYIVILSYEF